MMLYYDTNAIPIHPIAIRLAQYTMYAVAINSSPIICIRLPLLFYLSLSLNYTLKLETCEQNLITKINRVTRLEPKLMRSTCNNYFHAMMQVEHQRERLLSHPVVKTFIRRKWYRLGAWIFYFNVLLYATLMILLTAYMYLHFDRKHITSCVEKN